MIINELLKEDPQVGDAIDLECGDVLIETVIEDITENGIVVKLDETAMRLMMEARKQYITESRQGVAEGYGELDNLKAKFKERIASIIARAKEEGRPLTDREKKAIAILKGENQGVAEDSIEHLDEGIIDFISKAKDKFLRLKDALSDEWADSKEMWRIVKKGKTASQEEINFANAQFKDILRVVGLAAWYSLPIPGNTLLILTTEKLLNKVGMSIIPDKIRNQVLTSTKQGVAEMDNRTPQGDRREQRADSPEAIAQREKQLQAELKKVSPEMRRKLRLPAPKEGVAEGHWGWDDRRYERRKPERDPDEWKRDRDKPIPNLRPSQDVIDAEKKAARIRQAELQRTMKALARMRGEVEEGKVSQLPTRGADYSKYDTDHLEMMLRPGILHRNELGFKKLIRKELEKRRQAQPVNPKDLVVSLSDVPVKKPRGHTQYDPASDFPGVFKEQNMSEAEYQGRKVPLGKPMAGDVKKSKVYVKGPKGNVVKVNFGDKNMRIKKSNPNRRKSFRARHNCDNPGPRWKARYWSCRAW